MRRDPWRDSCPDFPNLMSRLSRLELLARICNLSPNPNAARPVGLFMSRRSRPYDKTFNTQTLGANVQFGSKSGCSATLARLISTLSRSYVQTFPTQTLGVILQFASKSGCGATLGGFCPDFSDLMTRLSGLKLSARLCNLGLNPEAARPLARFLSRLLRPFDKTFKVETLGATLQFGSKSECGATLGMILVQTVQNLCADFPDSNCWRKSAFWV